VCFGTERARGAENDPVSLPEVRLVVHGAEKPVELRKLDIRSDIAGHLAQTTVEMTFYNPNGRILEGELQFPLLGGQTVTGFALEMEDGEMREAVPVEKTKGRQIFEEVIRQNVDPALLEVTQGDNFKTRVYPLNPGQTRRVWVTYSERLAETLGKADSWGARPAAMVYRLPLSDADKVETFSLSVRIAGADKEPAIGKNPPTAFSFRKENGAYVVTAEQKDLRLQGAALELSIPLSLNETVYLGQRDGKTYFYAEVLTGLSPMMESNRVNPKTLSILWDASASGRKRGHSKELAFLGAFFSEVQNVTVTLQKTRDAADPAEKFVVKNGNWNELRKALDPAVLVYDGATNLGAFDMDDPSDMFFLFSDGLDNYSAAPVAPPASPLFAFVSSPGADTSRLKGIASRSGGALVDLTRLDPKAALEGMMKAPVQVISVEGSGVSNVVWSSPTLSNSTLAIAGTLNDPARPLRVVLSGGGKRFESDVVSGFEDLLSAGEKSSDQVPFAWASMRLERLEEEYDLNKGEIRRLGKAFGIATRETSLIVLDRAEDYVRYDIDPPAKLKKEYDLLRSQTTPRAADLNKLDRVLAEWRTREEWWEKSFPKGKMPPEKTPPKSSLSLEWSRRATASGEMYAASSAAMPDSSPSRPQSSSAVLRDISFSESKSGDAQEPDATQISVALRPWTPDAPYIRRMKEAEAKDLYRIYLDERPDYENSVAFYLDVAYQLRDRGQESLSLRVLSNLAEMDLENRHVLRVLGYRLLEAGKAVQAAVIFKKVLALGEEEPQSYRDLGLAYAVAGEGQKAIDSLYDVAEKSFARHFPGIEVIALTEMNAVIANAEKLDLSRIDPRFLSNRPLDLRVALTWDADNTDIDLHVVDPNGEEAFYGHPLSYQGGRVSPDNTEGYGPEEYSLKIAKPGKYRIEVNFYGHRQQILSDATTIQLDFFTHYGTKRQQKQSVTMRLKEAKERIVVGEFEVK
jgi:Flp pilus assembly protein TadD